VNLRRGDTGAAVAEVRARLVHIGLLNSGGDDQIFDAATEQAVRVFQQDRGLSVDGIVGKDTFRRLEEARWQLGDRVVHYVPGHLMTGDDVAELQRRLTQLGFDSGRADGMFGPHTDAALRDFQRSVGVDADGVCGPDTFLAFDRLVRAVSGGNAVVLRDQVALSALRTGVTDKTVVLHPGTSVDAELCLSIAKSAEGMLGALGTQVLLTRNDATDIDDISSAYFANDVDADLVVEIEVNTSQSSLPNGAVTFYYGDPRGGVHSVSGKILAERIHDTVVQRTGFLDGHCQPRTWDVLRLTRMPAVRVEVGYLSHPQDAAKLSTHEFRQLLAQAICDGIITFCSPKSP
jgi:N-acetylmuramoyl-L-alanine amidase